MDRVLNHRIALASAILGCVLLGTAESLTVLSPVHQNVREGGSFRLTCTSRVRTNGLGYQNGLYKVEEGGVLVRVPRSQVEALETKHTRRGNLVAIITTVFNTRDATKESAGRYGCLLLSTNTTSPTTVSEGDIDRVVTVRVCAKPRLELSQTGADPIHVHGRENCDYKGELTWLVNGRQAPRNQTPEAVSSPVIEGDDDTLEIRSAECEDAWAEINTCEVTAVFTYITAGRRVRSVSETLRITDCCVQSFGRAPRDDTNEGMSDSKWRPLHTEVEELKRDVLKYELTAMPLRISLLQRMNKDNSLREEMNNPVAMDI